MSDQHRSAPTLIPVSCPSIQSEGSSCRFPSSASSAVDSRRNCSSLRRGVGVPQGESNDTPTPFLHSARRPVSCRHNAAWSVRIGCTRCSSSAASDAEPSPRPQSARDTSDAASTSPCPSASTQMRCSDPLVKLFRQTGHWNGVSAKSAPCGQPMEHI
jgi:hypothetical protein